MKAYRRGECSDHRESGVNVGGGPWVIGPGSMVCDFPTDRLRWRLRNYLYRGAHRLNRFSRTVADIAEEIAADPPRRWVVRKLGPKCDLMNDGTMVLTEVLITFPPVPDHGVVMLIQPSGGAVNIPPLDLDLVSRA